MRNLDAQGLTVSVDAGSPNSSFLAVEGLRLTQLQIVNEGVELGEEVGDSWRRMLSGGGVRKVRLEASGLLLSCPAELRLRALALSGEEAAYRMALEQGRELRGRFVITCLALASPHDEEATFSLQLESSGDIRLV